jgi:predicted MFS family arabinose efflux permease
MGLSQVALAITGTGDGAWAYPIAVLGTSLLGLGAGVSAGPLNAYPQVLFPGRAEGAVVALHTITGAGLAFCPLLGAAAIDADAWIVFPLGLLALHVTATLGLERARLPRVEPEHEGATPARPLGQPALWLFLAIAFLYGTTEQLFGNWGIVFLVEERGLSPAAAGAAAAAFWASVAAGRAGVFALLLRVPAGPVLPALTALMAAGALLVPLVNGPVLAVAFFALGGLGCGAVFPLSVALASRRFPAHRAFVSSLQFAALVSGLGVGSFGAGLLRSLAPLGSIYQLGAAAPLVAGALALLALREGRRASGV